MRLSYIVEATSLAIANWEQKLQSTLPPGREDIPNMSDEQRKAFYRKMSRDYDIIKSAVRYHTKSFGGKRWPALENALLQHNIEHIITDYLNSITDEWPEGQQCLINDKSCGFHGVTDKTLQYLLNKNLESPHVLKHYDEKQSPNALRKHLRDREQELNNELQTELKKPPPPPPRAPEEGLDDVDEFHKWRQNLTVKQLQNRIKTVQNALNMPDAELKALAASKQSRTTMDALHFPWIPTSLPAYVAKYGR